MRFVTLVLSLLLVLGPAGCGEVDTPEARGSIPREYTYVAGDPSQSTLQPGVALEEIGSIAATGAPGPQEAARRYIVSVASGDTRRFEEVTGRLISDSELTRLREELFSQEAPIEVSDVFTLDLVAEDADTLLYHQFVTVPEARVIGIDVRVLYTSTEQWGALDARRWQLTSLDRDRAEAEIERRKAIDEMLMY